MSVATQERAESAATPGWVRDRTTARQLAVLARSWWWSG